MATHSSILAWKIPQKEEPGGLQSRVHKESDRTEHACFKNSNNKRSISIGDTRPPHCHKTTDQHASQVKPQPPSVPAASSLFLCACSYESRSAGNSFNFLSTQSCSVLCNVVGYHLHSVLEFGIYCLVSKTFHY